jgi:hypothetical protein
VKISSSSSTAITATITMHPTPTRTSPPSSGLVVISDFILMLLFMPAVILFYEKNIKTNGGKACCVGVCPDKFCDTEKHPDNAVVSFFANTTFDGIFVTVFIPLVTTRALSCPSSFLSSSYTDRKITTTPLGTTLTVR